MNSLSETDCKPVRVMCRRAQHTYEVTFTRQPQAGNLNYTSRYTDVLRRLEQRKSRRAFDDAAPTANGEVPAPRKLGYREFGERLGPRLPYRPEGLEDSLPRSEPNIPSYYYDRRGDCAEHAAEPEPEEPTPTGTLKTARYKLIQFLQTEEFFDEYSFIALMALMLAHMYRLSRAIFEMGCTAQTILSVFVYVWRFVQARVADILTTCGGPQAAYKCATFLAELVVIAACILLFLWAVFIPACSLIAVIVSKLFFLFA